MAKQTAKKESQELAETNKTGALVGYQGEDVDLLSAYSGAGLEEVTQDDIQIPFLRIIQKGSPQIDKNEASYIDSAGVGDIFDTATLEVFDGEKGVRVIPAYFHTKYIEWKPRTAGGGFVKDHGVDDRAYRSCKIVDNKRVTPEGNFIERTMTFYVFYQSKDGSWKQAVLGLSASNLTPGRNWITNLSTPRFLKNKETGALILNKEGKKIRLAMFTQSYLITSSPKSNDKGNWMQMKITKDLPAEEIFQDRAELSEFLQVAANYYEMAREQQVVTQTPQESSGDESGDADIPL